MPIRVWDFQQNKAVTVSDRDAEKGIAEGRYGARKQAASGNDIELPVTSPQGETGYINTKDAQQAFQEGYKLRGKQDLKSSEQVRQEALQETAADMPGTAFLKGALGTATFGLSDVVASQAGVDREFAQAVEEENPIASAAGTVAGALAAPAALPGRAVAQGARQLGQAAQAATRSKTIGKAADFGAEGLAYGFGESISDLALGDPNQVASNLILGGGLGAAIGGVGGVLAPAAKKVASKALELGEKSVVGLSEKVAPKVAKGIIKAKSKKGDETAQQAVDILNQTDETGAPYFKKLVNQGTKQEVKEASKAASAQVRAIEKQSKKQLDKVNKEFKDINATNITEAANELTSKAKQIRDDSYNRYGEAIANIEARVGQEALPAAAKKPVFEYFDELVNETIPALKQGTKYQTKPAVKIEQTINDLAAKLDSNPDDFASNLQALIAIRRDIGGSVRWNKPKEWTETEKVLSDVYKRTNDVIDGLDSNLSKSLREADESFHRAAEIRDMTRELRLPKREMFKASPAHVQAYAEHASNPKFAEFISKSTDYLDEYVSAAQASELKSTVDKLAEAKLFTRNKLMDDLDDLSPEEADDFLSVVENWAGKDLRKAADRARGLQKAIEQTKASPNMTPLEKAVFLQKEASGKSDKELADLMRLQKDMAVLEQFRGPGGNVLHQGVTTLGAGALGGPVAAAASLAVSKAINLINSPYNALAAVPVIEGVAKSGRNVADKFQKKLINSLASPAASRVSVAVDVSGQESSKYEARAEGLKQARDPKTLMDNASKSLENLSGAPNVQFALMSKITTANQYLQSKLPRDPLEGELLNPAMSKWKPSSQEMAEFNRIYEVVENPKVAMDKFSDGTITPEEAEAIQAVHPEIFRQMQSSVMEALTSMKKPVSYDKRVSLSIMFGIPTDPTTRGEYIQYMQQMINSYLQKDQQPKSNLKFDPDTLLSDSQRITYR
jgi:hypothetical protein